MLGVELVFEGIAGLVVFCFLAEALGGVDWSAAGLFWLRFVVSTGFTDVTVAVTAVLVLVLVQVRLPVGSSSKLVVVVSFELLVLTFELPLLLAKLVLVRDLFDGAINELVDGGGGAGRDLVDALRLQLAAATIVCLAAATRLAAALLDTDCVLDVALVSAA